MATDVKCRGCDALGTEIIRHIDEKMELQKENQRLRGMLKDIRQMHPHAVELGGYSRVVLSNYSLLEIDRVLHQHDTKGS